MVVGKLWFQAITNLHMGVNWDSGPNQGLEKQCLGPAARPKCTIHQGEPSKAFWISKSAPNDILALHNGILYIYINTQQKTCHFQTPNDTLPWKSLVKRRGGVVWFRTSCSWNTVLVGKEQQSLRLDHTNQQPPKTMEADKQDPKIILQSLTAWVRQMGHMNLF